MQIFLSVTPAEAHAAAAYGPALAHVAYRIGPDSTLLRQNLLLQTQGGLLSISDRDAPQIQDSASLCAAALRECTRRNYSGVLLDFEEPPQRDRIRFVQNLEQLLAERDKALYIPESYAPAAPQSLILISTAISGGSLQTRLQEASAQYNSRIVLDMERIRMDFILPSHTGTGIPLTTEEFLRLKTEQSPNTFFSPDLCARYFTYTRNEKTHFVLFDDAETLRKKIRLGESVGASAAFFIWPEIKDIAGSLFPSPHHSKRSLHDT